MTQQIHDIEALFSAYESLQSRHLELLKSQDIPDLKTMTKDREEVSDRLQAGLNDFMANAGSIKGGVRLLTDYETRLNAIMALDERIAAEIQRHREELKKALARMKQGKRAMTGYQASGKPVQTSRVFNLSR